jgi:hypothetical protein
MTRPTLDEMIMISMKARPTCNPPSAWLRLDWFVSADNAHALQPRALFQEYEVQLGGTNNPTQAPAAPQPRKAQKTHRQVQCIVRPVLCSRSKLTWLFGSMAAATLKVLAGSQAQRDDLHPSDQPGLRDSSLS